MIYPLRPENPTVRMLTLDFHMKFGDILGRTVKIKKELFASQFQKHQKTAELGFKSI